jgi:hypothetical protein
MTMSFDVTTADIHTALTPLGFRVEIDSQFEDEDYLRITHSSHVGIVIEASVLNNDKMFDEVSRKVEGGIEDSLSVRTTQAAFEALTESQRSHLYNIDFGEDLDHDSLNSMSDFVNLVQEKIVPLSTL